MAADVGAQVVRRRSGRTLVRIDKGGGDFATDVDIAAEREIVALLRSHRPSDGVVAEEAGHIRGADPARRWLVDPLCGTLNLAAGTGPVAVNVALVEGDEVVAAAVADPSTGVVDWVDAGSAVRRQDGHDRRLMPSPTSRLVDLNLDPPFPNRAVFSTVALLADPGFAAAFRPRVVSTSLALAWVASGQRAAYVTDGVVRDSVHFTAGIALALAAGCVVTNLRGGPLHTGVGGLVAAADRATHDTLMASTLCQFSRRSGG